MEDNRRKPVDYIFEDIKSASISVWSNASYHEDYISEKVEEILSTHNIGDNWYHIIGKFDSNNQLLMCCNLKYKDSVDFLMSMRAYYSIAIPREKI